MKKVNYEYDEFAMLEKLHINLLAQQCYPKQNGSHFLFFFFNMSQHCMNIFQDFFAENYTSRGVCRGSPETPQRYALLNVPPICVPGAPRGVCRSSPETS